MVMLDLYVQVLVSFSESVSIFLTPGSLYKIFLFLLDSF